MNRAAGLYLGIFVWAMGLTLYGADSSATAPSATSESRDAGLTLESKQPTPGIWESGVGEGFRATAQSFDMAVGASQGIQIFGSQHTHEFVLMSLAYGHMLGHTQATDRWYRGNWEIRYELFGGSQFAPSTEWLIGAAPHIRYNFATGTRFVPFVDAGAGVSGTSIEGPDLSGTFEFNVQGGAGVRWFVKDDLSVSVEGRYMHLSCAGLSRPNLGVNTVFGMVGVTWFF